jgi:hypothetical protein
MGYFPNGTAGMDYEDHYCSRCIHDDDEHGCAVMLAHNLYNYDECNKPESILHLLIPRSKNGLGNEQCLMFLLAPDKPPKCAADDKYREWKRKQAADNGAAS